MSGSHPPPRSANAELRNRFFTAGMTVLTRDGHAGLKQAAVCRELGVTTGAFYHAFSSWRAYTSELIGHWRVEATDRLVARVQEVTDVRERIAALTDVALALPHDAEAAIRVWATHDDGVAAALSAVDAHRTEVITAMGTEAIGDPELARRMAVTAMLLLIGYQMGSQADPDDFGWAMRGLADRMVRLTRRDQTPE